MRFKDDLYAKRYGFEIIAICRKCNEWWCTIEEYKLINYCEICHSGKYIELIVRLRDVQKLIKELI